METTASAKTKKTPKKPALPNVDMTKLVVVKDEVSKGQQSLYAERIIRVGDLKLRAEVKRDAYDFQSYARVSAWTTKEGWEVITTIPFDKMESKGANPYGTVMSVWEALVEKDLDTLMALATATLG